MKKTILNQYAEIRNSLTLTFSSPYFSFIGVVRTSINDDTGAMSEEQEMELEAVCLSRLYFALNRIQGSLQIDKKKKEGNKHFGMFEKSKRYVYKKRQNEKEAQ